MLDESLLNAAVSLVFYTNSQQWRDWELLFMQRAEHPKDPWSGHIAFPGGVVESSDSTTLDTAIRETQEEFGFCLDKDDWCGAMQPVLGPIIGDQKSVQIFPHVFLLQQKPELKVNEEVQSAFWLPMNRIIQKQYVFNFPHPLVQEQQMYAINVGKQFNVPLWGLSLEILYQFYEKVQWPVEQELKTIV